MNTTYLFVTVVGRTYILDSKSVSKKKKTVKATVVVENIN